MVASDFGRIEQRVVNVRHSLVSSRIGDIASDAATIGGRMACNSVMPLIQRLCHTRALVRRFRLDRFLSWPQQIGANQPHS